MGFKVRGGKWGFSQFFHFFFLLFFFLFNIGAYIYICYIYNFCFGGGARMIFGVLRGGGGGGRRRGNAWGLGEKGCLVGYMTMCAAYSDICKERYCKIP